MVLYESIHGAFGHLNIDQAIAGKIERDSIASGQRSGAQLCFDQPVVFDGFAQQGDVAACSCMQLAIVTNLCAGHVTSEFVITIFEIFVGDIECGSNQSTNVDLGILAEDNAIGVD